MPAVARKGDNCSGDGCLPPVPMLSPPQSSVFVNGQPMGVASTPYTDHACGKTVHRQRVVVGSSGAVFCNGKGVVRVGDAISCGAVVAQGSGNVFVGG